ncbi:acetate--CoA ligase alpha subunit [Aureliella helgolandensis]|uniref:Succinyl-CoA ligase [ADP-forming] subunit alpha n=1 Tax=Aureliella helgolandensis TaxID=2527968 RepID=A0A518G4V6_9BACT|nr:bifunctional acetate--CoA ligase family protein/GNAT family N-acetyltransferase [Aureliella helgolandensis]QDV23635.1 Succinyl-CoA ligase [ADP-forming] subunit alpha [Aureliella helgolandensis]
MPIRNLDKIFAPQSVAVIGASKRPSSVGNTVLQNLVSGGFAGAIYAVNSKYKEVSGVACFSRVGEIPEPVDLAVVCTPAITVPEVVRQCGEAGIRGVVILSAGFREASQEGAKLEAEVRAAAKQFDGLRIVGPNCLGIMAPHHSLNASFASDSPHKGRVAFISQSGALCTAVLDWAIQEKVGFSYFVSVGNMLDVGIADLIDYFATDDKTESIILYMESISKGREFMSAARAFARDKPIIAYKAGRFAESAKAAASHTGAMAGVDSVYEAAMARAGIVRVFDVDDLFDCAELLARQKTPSGPRLAIITNAGGPGVMATDALLDRHGVLAELSDTTIARLNEKLPATWSHGNPVDVIGDAPPERFSSAAEIVLADNAVDGVLVVLSPQAMTDPTGAAQAVIKVARLSHKPLIAAWMGGDKVREGIELLNDAGIPTYSSPEKAIRAFMHLVSYARNRETLYETPREVPIEFSLDRAKLHSMFDTVFREGQDILSETASKTLLEAYEIPVTKTTLARSAKDAVECAARLGYPVALKIFSPDITHKTDVGGVELNLANADSVAEAFHRILHRAKQHRPNARIEGVSVQHMLIAPNGRELIVGAKRDPVFGTVLMVGAGGTNAELFRDLALELPPLSEHLARRMLQSLQAWPLLEGYRGRPGVNLERLIEVLMRLSYLVADYPEIIELDVNPLLVTPEDAIALDARIVLDRQAVLHPVRPYSHLAIRPYPDEFTKLAKLKDGTSVVLRPIKPEDEPMWHALVASCSSESLHLRFRYMFKATTHAMATRFCFIDYDREIAMVAETQENGERRLIGVGRLVADADHREAEYAILVSDPWQGIGLGSALTDLCLDICGRWGVRSVVAEMAQQNHRMVHMFELRGFEIDRSHAQDAVVARKTLTVQQASSDKGSDGK